MLPMDDLGGQSLFQGSGMQMPQVPQMQKPAGMFGAGGVGRNIAGLIGDFLMQRAGMQPTYAPFMQRRQEMALQESQYQHHRQDSNDDWLSHQQYEDVNKPPSQTDRYVAEVLDPNTPPERRELLKSILVPPVPGLTNQATGQQYVSAAKAPSQPPPADAVARLRANPAEAQQFDEIFGPGTSASILGGPTQPASGGFPGQ